MNHKFLLRRDLVFQLPGCMFVEKLSRLRADACNTFD